LLLVELVVVVVVWDMSRLLILRLMQLFLAPAVVVIPNHQRLLQSQRPVRDQHQWSSLTPNLQQNILVVEQMDMVRLTAMVTVMVMVMVMVNNDNSNSSVLA
jgi:hypothetical protein